MGRAAKKKVLEGLGIAAVIVIVLGVMIYGGINEEASENQHKDEAQSAFTVLVGTVETACKVSKDPDKLIKARGSFEIAVSRYLQARNVVLQDALIDGTPSLPTKIGSLEEESQSICPGVFKTPKPKPNQEE